MLPVKEIEVARQAVRLYHAKSLPVPQQTLRKGTLEVIVGCMMSGKSEELIRRLRLARIEKKRVMVFKPATDTRTPHSIRSRNKSGMRAIPVADPTDILQKIARKPPDVVGFDEVQFFPEPFVGLMTMLVDDFGLRVLACGLDTNFRGEPFGIVPALLALADDVVKKSAICVNCRRPATRTQRILDGVPAPYDSPEVAVGGDDLYEPRCRSCHEVPRTDAQMDVVVPGQASF